MLFRGVTFIDYAHDKRLTWTQMCAECIVRHFIYDRKAALDRSFDILEYLKEPQYGSVLTHLPCAVEGCTRKMDYIIRIPDSKHVTFPNEAAIKKPRTIEL